MLKIAVFTKNFTNPAYAAARLGADRAATALGVQAIHFVPQTPDDPEEQSALVDQALAIAPDAFVFSPVHATRVDAAIGRIASSNIPVIGFVNPIQAVSTISFIGADDAHLADAIARRLFSHLGGQGRVLVVGGPVESVTSIARLQGFQNAAQDYPRILLDRPIAGDYDRGVARARCTQWLHVNAKVDGILAANDIMAIGVLEALDAAGRTAPVVGVNAIPDAIDAIRNGRMLATADFNAMKMAYLATECAARHLRGEAVPAHIELPVQIVDQGNFQLWDLPYVQRPVISLMELTK